MQGAKARFMQSCLHVLRFVGFPYPEKELFL